MSSSSKHLAHSDFSASRDGANCRNEIIVGTESQELFMVPINMSSAELNTGPIKVQPLGIPNEHGTLSLLRTYAISISLLYYILCDILT